MGKGRQLSAVSPQLVVEFNACMKHMQQPFDFGDMFIEGHVTHRVTGIRGRAPGRRPNLQGRQLLQLRWPGASGAR